MWASTIDSSGFGWWRFQQAVLVFFLLSQIDKIRLQILERSTLMSILSVHSYKMQEMSLFSYWAYYIKPYQTHLCFLQTFTQKLISCRHLKTIYDDTILVITLCIFGCIKCIFYWPLFLSVSNSWHICCFLLITIKSCLLALIGWIFLWFIVPFFFSLSLSLST